MVLEPGYILKTILGRQSLVLLNAVRSNMDGLFLPGGKYSNDSNRLRLFLLIK